MASPYPHYAWAGGHILLLAASLRYLLSWITLKSVAYVFWYRLAFSGALASYAIVVYKSLGAPQSGYLRKALADENFQYFALALYWFMSRPMALALVPYATFSLFHVLTFARTNLLPMVFPPSSTQAERNAQSPIAKSLHAWVKANYDPAMRCVAWTELVILVRVIIGAVVAMLPYVRRLPIKTSVLTPLIFIHFLRLRYYHSSFTRQVVQASDVMLAKRLSTPNVDPRAKKVYETVRSLVITWAGSTSIQPQTNGPPATHPAASGGVRK